MASFNVCSHGCGDNDAEAPDRRRACRGTEIALGNEGRLLFGREDFGFFGGGGHDIGELETEALATVDDLKDETDDESGHAERGEHHEGSGVVVADRGLLGGHCACGERLSDVGVGGVEHFADEQREEPEADVLNPENQRVGRADDFGVDELGHAGPKRSGHERERGAEHEDGEVGHGDSADGRILELGQDEGEGEVAGYKEERAEHEHRSCAALMVDVVAEDGGDANGEEGEDGEDGRRALAFVAHDAESHEGDDGHRHKTPFEGRLTREVAGESTGGHDNHDDVLHHDHRVGSPERVGGDVGESQVALQHVDGILLEWEDGRVVEHAEQSHEPEARRGEDLAEVAQLEGVVFLFLGAGLGVKLLVHKEIDDKHDEGNHQEHHAEGHGARHRNDAAESGKHGRENHTRCYAETRESHFGTHGESHLAAFEPFDDAAADGDAGHFDSAAENHETDSRELGRGRHAFIEGGYAEFVENGDIVEMLGKPYVEARTCEGVGEGIPVDCGADEHDGTREDSGEAHAHLVEDDAGKNEEEDEDVEEGLRALHRAEGGGVPSLLALQEVFDRRENVHEDVGAEHCKRQQSERGPTRPGLVVESHGGFHGS